MALTEVTGCHLRANPALSAVEPALHPAFSSLHALLVVPRRDSLAAQLDEHPT